MTIDSHKINTLIVDDEPLSIEGLTLKLANFDDIAVVATACNADKAIDYLKQQPVDLMFVDIQMPGKTGFELVEALVNESITLPTIVFITAYSELAVKAFETQAIDYLLKPISSVRLDNTIENVRTMLCQQTQEQQKNRILTALQQHHFEVNNLDIYKSSAYTQQSTITVQSNNEWYRIKVDNIYLIEARYEDTVLIHAFDGKHNLDKSLIELESELDNRIFIKVSRNIIININAIKSVETNLFRRLSVTLNNKSKIMVSRQFKPQLINALSFTNFVIR